MLTFTLPPTFFINLAGGLGLFLLGMTLLTDGLKLAAGRTLERLLTAWTSTRWRGLLTGFMLTALVQSSSALTVAVIGFVNAGLLSFTSTLWVVFGSNIGTTVTGWLVAWIGFQIDIDAYALPLVGLGMLLKLTSEGTRRGGLGAALAGFGVLFLGIDMLKNSFTGLDAHALPPLGNDPFSLLLAVGIGIGVTMAMQASAATLTLALTAVAGGLLPLETGASIVIGANIGTTITGVLAAIGATSNGRRLAAAHVLFNVITAVVALGVLQPTLWLIHSFSVQLNGNGDAVTQLVLFHTVFNVLGVLLMWPLSDPLARFLLRRFHTRDEDNATPHYLDRNVAAVPVLALQALRRELARMGQFAVELAVQAIRLNPLALPWQPPATEQDQPLTQHLSTVEQLQLHIGTFVSDISRRPLPPDVANQLPELLRIATHFDTLARVMYHIGLQSTHPEHHPVSASTAPDAHSSDAIACVVPAFADALAFFQIASPDDATPTPHNQHHLASEARERFETTYQNVKAQLLRMGANGQSHIHTVYDWLARLSDLRRAVEQTDKAVQRLAALPDLTTTPGEPIPAP